MRIHWCKALVLVCVLAAGARAEGPGMVIKSIREIQEAAGQSAVLAPTEIMPVPPAGQAPYPALPASPAPAATEYVPPPGPSGYSVMPSAPRADNLDADRPISAVRTIIASPPGNLPTNLAAQHFGGEGTMMTCRPWESVLYNWDAPDLCYGALRYEEVNLERLGYTYHPLLQPGISAAHFVGSTLALPYSMALHPPGECIYPLGHYRPGSPAPYQWHWPENSLKAHGVQAATITGLIFLIP